LQASFKICKCLRRFVNSPICPAEDPAKYKDDLKLLADEVMDPNVALVRSRLFRALSDPTRLRMTRLLMIREMCVCEILVALDLTQPTASHHLNILENAGLIKGRKEGRWVFYSLAMPDLVSDMKNLNLL